MECGAGYGRCHVCVQYPGGSTGGDSRHVVCRLCVVHDDQCEPGQCMYVCYCQGLSALLKHDCVADCVVVSVNVRGGWCECDLEGACQLECCRRFAGQRGASEWLCCTLASVYIAMAKTVGRQQHQRGAALLGTDKRVMRRWRMVWSSCVVCSSLSVVWLGSTTAKGRQEDDDRGVHGVFIVRSVMALTCHAAPQERPLLCACLEVQLLHCCSSHVGSTRIACLYAALLPLLRK